MQKRVLALAAAALLSTVASPASSASAAPTRPADCTANYVCLYENQNLSGGLVAKFPSYYFSDCAIRTFADGRVSSVYNDTGWSLSLYNRTPYHDTPLDVGTAAPHKGYNGLGAGDDQADRIRVAPPTCDKVPVPE